MLTVGFHSELLRLWPPIKIHFNCKNQYEGKVVIVTF